MSKRTNTTTTTKPRAAELPRRKRGRQFEPRPCSQCRGAVATWAIQPRIRSIGPGQGAARLILTGPVVLLCDSCSRSHDYAGALLDSAAEVLRGRSRRIPPGPGLFQESEALIQ
jgi:hypothetical protein